MIAWLIGACCVAGTTAWFAAHQLTPYHWRAADRLLDVAVASLAIGLALVACWGLLEVMS